MLVICHKHFQLLVLSSCLSAEVAYYYVIDKMRFQQGPYQPVHFSAFSVTSENASHVFCISRTRLFFILSSGSGSGTLKSC